MICVPGLSAVSPNEEFFWFDVFCPRIYVLNVNNILNLAKL